MKAILFDLDGVFYESDQAVPGAADVVSWVCRYDIPHLFLTNTTSRSRSELAGKLADFGIDTDENHILTPPVVANAWLQRHARGKVALFVAEGVELEFPGLRIAEESDTDVSAVVVGDLGERWDYAILNRVFRWLMQTPQPSLIALGMTRYWKADDGLRLDVAPFVVALQHATGCEPRVLGKPSVDFYQTALDMLDVAAAETVMIGDDIRGDIDGAQRCGIPGVLVKTGKFRPADLDGDITPDAILNSVVDLPAWWEKNVGHPVQ